jgi:putative membrane protein
MGNYQLIMIDAVNNLDLNIIAPVGIGCVVGLVVFSHGLSWLFKTYKDQTIAVLTGFIFGSLAILWPWKKSFDIDMNLVHTNNFGAFISEKGAIIEDVKIASYKPILPEMNTEFIIAIGYIVLGFISIFIIEKVAQKNHETN